MVTAKTQYSLSNAQSYFAEHLAVGDYYQEGQKVAGEWFGAGASSLGLSGRVGEAEFLALCENQHPRTGACLTQRKNSLRTEGGETKANRRIFYDFTFSPPKSVSIAALVAGYERIVESHERAVHIALTEFETFAATRVRKRRADDSRLTQNVVAALFTHDTSRALDPHLHSHCIVFNATHDPKEQRWKALQNHEMLRA
ncbi:MAG: relaxase domain-containing protein [Verrucomicrobiales bacterium]|nr:relaxase domain-containing protein [Verrucomicrobiales bacterium]